MCINKQEIADVLRDTLCNAMGVGYINKELRGAEKIVDEALEAKKYFIEAFNGELIYEVKEDVTFHLNNNEKKALFLTFIAWLEDMQYDDKFIDFVKKNKYGFFDNCLMWCDIPAVNENTKLTKVFKYYIDDENKLRKAQDKASEYIQKNKITGKLCFSVHPLDFITLSENNCNWRSCHALDGDYRSGNLSYMLDSNTFICYLKKEKDTQLRFMPKGFLWNDKEWRMLCHTSDNKKGLWYGRQYPFYAAGNAELCTYFLNQAFANKEWRVSTPYDLCFRNIKTQERELELYQNYLLDGSKIYPLDDLVYHSSYEEPTNFNDLVNSSCYSPLHSQISNTCWFEPSEDLVAEVGRTARCFCCGEKCSKDGMLCYNCTNKYNQVEFEYREEEE